MRQELKTHWKTRRVCFSTSWWQAIGLMFKLYSLGHWNTAKWSHSSPWSCCSPRVTQSLCLALLVSWEPNFLSSLSQSCFLKFPVLRSSSTASSQDTLPLWLSSFPLGFSCTLSCASPTPRLAFQALPGSSFLSPFNVMLIGGLALFSLRMLALGSDLSTFIPPTMALWIVIMGVTSFWSSTVNLYSTWVSP